MAILLSYGNAPPARGRVQLGEQVREVASAYHEVAQPFFMCGTPGENRVGRRANAVYNLRVVEDWLTRHECIRGVEDFENGCGVATEVGQLSGENMADAKR